MKMEKGFTLVEMLVVIGIIGVLMAVMMGTFSGSTDSARAALCLANMKNLANACQSYGADKSHKHYPLAGGLEWMDIDESEGVKRVKKVYGEHAGWVSWDSQGKYPSTGKQSPGAIGFMCEDEQKRQHALTNGAIWKYVAHNAKTYVCPLHALKCKGGGGKARQTSSKGPLWSYLMNSYFDWGGENNRVVLKYNAGQSYGSLSKADRILMFSEIPFQGPGNWFPDGGDGSTDGDGVLMGGNDKSKSSGDKGQQSSVSNAKETIGGNHKSGKYWYAHVVFADGHTEKLNVTNLDDGQLKQLTAWLCNGTDVSYDGKTYSEFK